MAKNDHFDDFLGPPGHINLFLLFKITLKHIKRVFHTLGAYKKVQIPIFGQFLAAKKSIFA